MEEWKIEDMDPDSLSDDLEIRLKTLGPDGGDLYTLELPPGTSLEEIVMASIPRADEPLLDRQRGSVVIEEVLQPEEIVKSATNESQAESPTESQSESMAEESPKVGEAPSSVNKTIVKAKSERVKKTFPKSRLNRSKKKIVNSQLKKKMRIKNSRTESGEGRRKRRNPFITFFLSMYSRRPRKRAADVARQAGRQWGRMTDRQRRKYVTMPAVEDWRRDQDKQF